MLIYILLASLVVVVSGYIVYKNFYLHAPKHSEKQRKHYTFKL